MDKKIVNLLIAYSYKLLNRRPQSEKEFTQKLTRYVSKRAISDRDNYITEVVKRLKEMNLINDVDFAKWYVQQRADFRPRSKRMLSFELAQKGIEGNVVEQTLENYDEEEAMKQITSRKSHLTKEKLVNYLLRSGFPYELIKGIIETH